MLQKKTQTKKATDCVGSFPFCACLLPNCVGSLFDLCVVVVRLHFHLKLQLVLCHSMCSFNCAHISFASDTCACICLLQVIGRWNMQNMGCTEFPVFSTDICSTACRFCSRYLAISWTIPILTLHFVIKNILCIMNSYIYRKELCYTSNFGSSESPNILLCIQC